MFRLVQLVQGFCRRAPTRVFHKLTDKELATPQLTNKLMRKLVIYHEKPTIIGLYHKKRDRHAIRSCFSEKKTKYFRRVSVAYRRFHSDILGLNLHIKASRKAVKCIEKAGSFDNYILTTKPEDLDSKRGEYLRELMLRKINDPTYRLPYVLGSNHKPRIRHYRRFLFDKQVTRQLIPRDFKLKMQTMQRKFGSSVEELSQEDYQKYLSLERMQRELGQQMEEDHPLIRELNIKLNPSTAPDQVARLQELSKKAQQDYLNQPKFAAERRAKFDKLKRENEALEAKTKEAWFKYFSYEK